MRSARARTRHARTLTPKGGVLQSSRASALLAPREAPAFSGGLGHDEILRNAMRLEPIPGRQLGGCPRGITDSDMTAIQESL